jgi:hypothetical protein
MRYPKIGGWTLSQRGEGVILSLRTARAVSVIPARAFRLRSGLRLTPRGLGETKWSRAYESATRRSAAESS